MNTLDFLHEKTKGRRFVLVVMAYKDAKTKADKRVKVYELINEVVEKEFNLACVRADHVLNAGHELLGKIHLLIDRASLVLAEISDPRPNVFYELGYAMGLKKTPVLLLETGSKPPYDLQGLEVFEYENSLEGGDIFRKKLTEHLRMRLKPELPLLREMLAPTLAEPSYIVASPKYPGAHSRIQGQVYDSRTFGDHLGILGLISAFGQFYGDAKGLELISAQHAPPDLLTRDINLFLIGSRKVNRSCGAMLERLSHGHRPRWEFRPAPDWKSGEQGDWPVALYRVEPDKAAELRGERTTVGKQKTEEIWTSDYGIILRGPHPQLPHRQVMMMAGPHSLGTAAACLAATRISLIEQIRAKLPEEVLGDKRRTFWVLVKGVSTPDDYLLNESGVTIEEVGLYGGSVAPRDHPAAMAP